MRISVFVHNLLLDILSKKRYNADMEPMKIVRNSARYRYQQKRKQRNRVAIVALLAAVVLIVLLIVLINRPSGEIAEDDVTVFPTATVNSENLVNGGKVELKMSVGEVCMIALPEGIDICDITFTSENPSVVRVDDGGRLDALQAGSAKIIATALGFNAICECSVSSAPAPVDDGKDGRLTTAYTANLAAAEQNAKTAGIGQYVYSLTVNRRTNTVTAYTYDQSGKYTVPVRAMVCSCGKEGDSMTPTGEYEVYYREDWLSLSGNVYGQYISGFYGDFLFHSVPYYTPNCSDLKVEEFNKLGNNASEGCVRLMAADVLWIYENCPVGTSVKVIDADVSADPLGKPPTVKISNGIKWDPTDPDPANPYKGKMPVITGVEDVTLSKGGTFDAMKDVKATDICGNDITDRVTIKGSVVSDKPGVYYLTYTVWDEFGRTVEEDRVVIVNK